MMKQHKIQIHLAALAVCSTLLTGCGVFTRSEFTEPQVTIPASWQQTQVAGQVNMDPWWTSFDNPELNQLIEQVLANNNDLALATLTLRRARLQAGITDDQYWPQLSANTGVNKSKPLDGGDSSTSYNAAVSVSYEVDLWGRVSADVDQARWSAMASQQDRESTAQTLVATTASLYWQIGYLKQRLQLSQNSIDYAKQTLTLTQQQYATGAVSQLNVLEAQRSLAGQEASHSELVQQLVEAQNAMAILFDRPPEQFPVSIDKLPEGKVPQINAGVPADLLVRRPDIKAALYQLKASLAAKDATFTQYFPALTLTGSVGDSSSQLKDLLRNPIGTLGAGLTLPFLQWRQMSLNNDIADIDYQSATINYRQALYQAFEDVDNAISARQQYAYQGEKLQLQYDSAVAAEKIYASQYRNGAVSIQDWLNAQETMRNAEASLLQNRLNQLTAQSTLYQALGGRDIAPAIVQ
ncbi:efflux transporter outer membrane subunit [Shewanella sp.]|uniref:efflux transporter outer membrane subunit n=1 Tax=Shewanella sp. TaxID=50422 RepID=UPI003A969BA0